MLIAERTGRGIDRIYEGMLRYPEPSAGDDQTTRELLKVCKLIQLTLLDHVIVGETDHYSYADSGQLQEFEND